MTYNTRFLAVLTTSALLLSGCVVRFTDDPSAFDDDTTSASNVTAGTGGSDSSSSVAAGGGGGMGPMCVGEEGSGEEADICDTFAIAPQNSGLCGENSNEESIAYLSCKAGYQLFNPGQAEDLARCLEAIPAANACELDSVDECVGEMYDNTCFQDYVPEVCGDWNAVCNEGGESIDVDRCTEEIAPFNPPTINKMIDCLNVTKGHCQTRYDICFDEALTL